MSEALRRPAGPVLRRGDQHTAASYPPERRLAGPQLAGYLDRAFRVIGSPSPRRPPHAAAMSAFVAARDRLWLPTAADRCVSATCAASPG